MTALLVPDLDYKIKTAETLFGSIPGLVSTEMALTRLNTLAGFLSSQELFPLAEATPSNAEHVVSQFKAILLRLCRYNDTLLNYQHLTTDDRTVRCLKYKTVLYGINSALDFEFQMLSLAAVLRTDVPTPDWAVRYAERPERVFDGSDYYHLHYRSSLYGGLICDQERFVRSLRGERFDYIWSSHT